MVDNTEKRCCVTIRIPEVDIIITMPADKKQIDIFTENNPICWIFGQGIQITIDKDFLEHFSIEPMQ